MLFVIHCIDKKDNLQVRLDNRSAHIEYLKSYGEKLHAAGPTLTEDETMNGSVIILDLEDRAAAEAFAAKDPYNKAWLFASVTISAWKKVLP
jgi:uncharacterized protein YciI